jgi:hypothetical protein
VPGLPLFLEGTRKGRNLAKLGGVAGRGSQVSLLLICFLVVEEAQPTSV